MKLIPFEIEHLDLFEMRDEDKKHYGDCTPKHFTLMSDNAVCFTAIHDGRIMVCGGIIPQTENTGYCWTFCSVYAKEEPRLVINTVRNQLEAMMQTMKMHRVETANLKDAHDHHKWCIALGFKDEGILRYYDDEKRDYIRFAKYWEGK